MPQFVRRARSPLNFIPVAYNPWVMRVIHWALPFFLRIRVRPWLPVGIQRIEVENVERLVDLYAQFEAGKTRFLMAVRHVEVDDPLSGLYMCSRAVAKAAKAQGIRLKQPVHSHFIYERGMTIWAGDGIGWLLSRIGGTPIRRGRRPDWVGLKAARKLLTEGCMPLVVAPEGATNGHSQRLGPLEPGVAQLGFWCAEDLQRANRTESVSIIPIGLQYRYCKPNWPRLSQVLSQLEAQSGLSPQSQAASSPSDRQDQKTQNLEHQNLDKDCHLRILRLGEHLMRTMETFYQRWYHRHISEVEASDSKVSNSKVSNPEVSNPEDNHSTTDASERLRSLLDQALQVSESFFNLPGKGNLVDRCRRLEEASWTYIYREDLPELSTLSPLERGLADWTAQEASLRELHMRIVESFVAVDEHYLHIKPGERPSFERCAEITLLMSDMLGRLGGDRLPGRPRLGNRWVKMTVQEPIALTPHLQAYQKNRRSGRTAVATITEKIRQALEETIED
ncbi:MAG: 1-acyl-sn-glycerol-3-phosphate acyltransferase [Cyanobacteria bacterium P01_F01_bin.53]